MSSQFLTALLMALPLTGQAFEIHMVGELISKPYIDITLKLMAQFGVDIINEDYRVFKIQAGAKYHAPEHLYVEGDASSASYFLGAGLIAGTPIRVTGIGAHSIQGDVASHANWRKSVRMSFGAKILLKFLVLPSARFRLLIWMPTIFQTRP